MLKKNFFFNTKRKFHRTYKRGKKIVLGLIIIITFCIYQYIIYAIHLFFFFIILEI